MTFDQIKTGYVKLNTIELRSTILSEARL